MTTPVSDLDERYRDPQACATGWDEIRRVLDPGDGRLRPEQDEDLPHEQDEGLPHEQDEGLPHEQVEGLPHEQDEGLPHEQDEGLPPILVFAVTPAEVLVFTRGGHTTRRF
jgi:hypothetical protein